MKQLFSPKHLPCVRNFFRHIFISNNLYDETNFLTQNEYIGWWNNFPHPNTYLLWEKNFHHLFVSNNLGDEISFLTQNKYIMWRNNFSHPNNYLLWEKIRHLLFSNNFGDETSFLAQSPFVCEIFFYCLLVLSL